MKKYDILILGDDNVGKTALFQRFRGNRFSATKIMADQVNHMKKIKVGKEFVELCLWDIAGALSESHNNNSLSPVVDAALFVVDPGNTDSLANVGTKWLAFYEERLGENKLDKTFLVLNKIDTMADLLNSDDSFISEDDFRSYFNEGPITFDGIFKVSAETSKGVDEMFFQVASTLLEGAHKNQKANGKGGKSKTKEDGACVIL